MDLRETGCGDGRWIELAQDRVQWRALVLVALGVERVAGPCAGHGTGGRAAVWMRVSDVLDVGTNRSRGI
jgi:hypothetical protein